MINVLIPVIATLLMACTAASPHSHEYSPRGCKMKDTDAIVLTEGIVGGIIAPHVRLKIYFVPNKDGVNVWIKQQPDRTTKAKYFQGEMKVAEFKELVASLQAKKIWDLPVESPRGSQDIYRLDTALNVRLGDQSWSNGGPQGCVHGQSKTQASDKQRKSFSQIVDLLTKTAHKHATTEIDATKFDSAAAAIAKNAQRLAEKKDKQ